MPNRQTYEPDPSFQLAAAAGPTGPFDCSAHSTSDLIDYVTMGAKDPGGRAIRLASNEPRPDRLSPGLNLAQVAYVALSRYNVYIDVRTGSRALTRSQYESYRLAGRGMLPQLDYAPIARSPQDAGRGFGERYPSGHMMFESHSCTQDPLADGRPGAWKYNGAVYNRDLMFRAMARLWTGSRTVGANEIWCGFSHDVVPDTNYFVHIKPSFKFFRYYVENGVIFDREPITNRSFTRPCTVPLSRPYPTSKGGTGRYYSLVRIKSGSYDGWYVERQFAHEVKPS